MTWIILALAGAVMAALVAIFGKIGMQNMDSTFATTIRAIVMAIFLIITSAFLGKLNFEQLALNKEFFWIVLSAIAGALSWVFMFAALKLGPASAVSAIDRLSIVFVVLLAALFLGEALTIKSILGTILIVAGALLVTM